MKRLRLALACALALITVPQARAAIPWMINYQGRLTDVAGVAIVGTNTFTFRLYDAATSGNKVWEENQTITMSSDDNGVFNVVLGSVTALTSVDFNAPLWLAMQIGSDSEMTPRQRITAVGYAINADQLDTLDSSKFLRTDIDTATSGKVTITRAGAALVVAPSSAPAAGTKMLNVQNAAGTTRFSVDYEGDVTVAGDLTVSGTMSGTTSTTGTKNTTWTVDDDNTSGTEPASGAGLVIEGGSGDASILWDATNDELDINKAVNIGAALTAGSLGLTTPLGPTQGGTGLSSYAAGDLLYASAVNTLAKLAAGSDGKVLKLSSGLPVWGDDSAGTGTMATVSEGGTALDTDIATIDFQSGFDLTESPENEANISLDLSEVVTGDVTFTGNVAAIAGDSIVNADINSAAAIDFSKLATLTSGNILVGNATHVAASVNPSGDVDISNTGAFTIQSNAVALGDDTTGAYVATITQGGPITVSGSGVESAAITIDCPSCVTTGSGNAFTLAGTSGANQTITLGDTLTIGAGTGVTTTGQATDTVAVAVDQTFAPTWTGAHSFNKANAAGGSATALTLSGALAAMDATGTDIYRGVYLNLDNSANHTGGSVYAVDVAALGANDAQATETALQIGTGWDMAASIGGPMRLFGVDAGNNAAVDAPAVTLRGSYDSDAGAGVTATSYDATLTHNVSVAGGAASATLDFDIGGGGTDFAINQAGAITTGTWSATAIDPTKGGTGLTTYAQGDLLYASGVNTLAALADPNVSDKVLKWNDATNLPEWGTDTSGVGTVTSVGLAAPTAEFDVTNSPVTGAGTLTLAWDSQTTNKVFAAPNGSTGTPAFRALVANDLPSDAITETDIGTGLGVATGTVNFAPAEVGAAIWLDNASRIWTFDAGGASDPAITFSNDTINVSTGVLQVGGKRVLTNAAGHLPIEILIADATSPPSANTVGITPTADFSPTADQIAYFTIKVPDDCDILQPMVLKLNYGMSTADTGNVVMVLAYESVANGGDVTPAAVTATKTDVINPPNSAEILDVFTGTNLKIDASDLSAAGQNINCKLYRDADTANDDHTGVFQLLNIMLTYTKSTS